MRHVARMRFYVKDIAYALDCLKAYAEDFKGIGPVITMVEVNRLARADRLVEVDVEAGAFMGSYPTSRLTEPRPI